MKIIDKFKVFFGLDRKISDILKDTKHRMFVRPNSSKRFICHHVDVIANPKQSKYIRNWIRDLLDGSSTLEGWLYLNAKIYYANYTDDVWDSKMMETRLRWLNWMIAHWEGVEAKEKIQKAEKRKEYLLNLFSRKK